MRDVRSTPGRRGRAHTADRKGRKGRPGEFRFNSGGKETIVIQSLGGFSWGKRFLNINKVYSKVCPTLIKLMVTGKSPCPGSHPSSPNGPKCVRNVPSGPLSRGAGQTSLNEKCTWIVVYGPPGANRHRGKVPGGDGTRNR